MADSKPYGTTVVKQPGGAQTRPQAKCTDLAAPRLGPAKPGGNPKRNLNPYK